MWQKQVTTYVGLKTKHLKSASGVVKVLLKAKTVGSQ